MYKTIIVPIDMGHLERVDSMINAARELGSKAHLILANAVETIPTYIQADIPMNFVEGNKRHSKAKLEEIAKSVDGDCSVEMMDGNAAAAILELAEAKKADAIVIASHKPGWQDYLLGSTASRVVRHAKCSVLVVR